MVCSVWHHVGAVPIFYRNLLPAPHQYETLEQTHPNACSHIPNVTSWSHMNITHTHTNTHMTVCNETACWERRRLSWQEWNCPYWFHILSK